MSEPVEIAPYPDGFTILVACYNDGNIISNLLESVLHQAKPNCNFELIIADNKSNDSTKIVCEKYKGDFRKKDIGYNYIYIDQQGKSSAIEIAIKQASYNHIIFTDADAKMDEKYLVNLEKLTHDVRAVAYCGPYKPWFNPDAEIPEWYKEKYNERILVEEDGYLPDNIFGSGINMVICKSVYDKTGGVPKHINYTGGNTGRGFDTELANRIKNTYNGRAFYYSNKLVVYHYTRSEYFSMRYMTKWTWSNSKMLSKIYPRFNFLKNIKIISGGSLEITKDLFKFLLGKYRQQYKFVQNLYMERILATMNNVFIAIHQVIR